MLGYIILILLVLMNLIFSKKKSIFYYYSIIYGIFYGVIPIIWMNFNISGNFHINIEKGIEKIERLNQLSYICLLSYCFMYIGYLCSKKIRVNKKNYIKKILNKYIYIYSILFFLLSFFSINILVFSFGNYISAIPKIINLRWINNKVEIPFAFLRIFNPFIIASFYGFYSLKKTKYKSNFLLIISFIISIYFLILQSGRSHIIMFFLPIMYVEIKKMTTIKKILLLSIFGLFIFTMIIFGDDLRRITMGKEMVEFSNNSKLKDIIDKLVIQLSNPIFNLLSIPENIKKTGYRFGIDLFSFINLIPKVSLKPLWKINSENFNSSTSGIIVDQLTFGYYQLSIFGSYICSFFLGIIIRISEKYFINKNNILYDLLEARIVILYIGLLQHFDIEGMIRANLPFLLLLILMKIKGEKNERIS